MNFFLILRLEGGERGGWARDTLSQLYNEELREGDKEQTTHILLKIVMKLYFYWSILSDEPLQDRLIYITYDEIHN